MSIEIRFGRESLSAQLAKNQLHVAMHLVQMALHSIFRLKLLFAKHASVDPIPVNSLLMLAKVVFVGRPEFASRMGAMKTQFVRVRVFLHVLLQRLSIFHPHLADGASDHSRLHLGGSNVEVVMMPAVGDDAVRDDFARPTGDIPLGVNQHLPTHFPPPHRFGRMRPSALWPVS